MILQDFLVFLDIIQPIPLVILHLLFILLATRFIHCHSQLSVHSLTNVCHQDLVNL